MTSVSSGQSTIIRTERGLAIAGWRKLQKCRPNLAKKQLGQNFRHEKPNLLYHFKQGEQTALKTEQAQ